MLFMEGSLNDEERGLGARLQEQSFERDRAFSAMEERFTRAS
jgi:hypothetical protein